MKFRRMTYWVTTILVALVMTISGVLALVHAPAMMKALARLGYPVYFSDLLGAAKLAGVCVLLLPRAPRLKEWAYVGFGITVLSAVYSHLMSGAGAMALEPLITLVVLAVSYWTRPSSRRFFPASTDSLNSSLRTNA
jgi:DoxX-like protein